MSTSTTALTNSGSSPAIVLQPADISQRISCDLRALTCVGIICSIALAILFAAYSHNFFSYLSIGATAIMFRAYQEIQIVLDPSAGVTNEQHNLFKLTQIKIGQLITLIGDSLTAAGKYLTS